MKKYLFMALAAFAFVSCSNDYDANEVVTNKNAKPISFSVYTDGASRGVINTTTTIKNQTSSGGGIKVIMDTAGVQKLNQVLDVIWADQSSTWSGGKVFWPAGINVDFFFYAPANVLSGLPSPNTPINGTNYASATYSYNQPAAPSNQKDILYGAPVFDQTATSSSIPVVLSHVMSHITFKVLSGPNNTSGVTVSSIKLKGNFTISGTMNFRATSSADFWGADTLKADTVYSPLPKVSTFTDKSTAQDLLQDGEDMFIIPCYVPSAIVEVTYNCEGALWTKSVDIGPIKFAITNSYVITLVLDADLVKFDVSEVPAWTPGTVSASY